MSAKVQDSIQLYTVNGRKPSALIPLKRYEAMRRALLKALRNKPDGLSLTELAHAAAVHLPKWWSEQKWDELWHTTAVKLHLEYLGELERVPKASPHRVRIAVGRDSVPAAGAKHASPARSARTRGSSLAELAPPLQGSKSRSEDRRSRKAAELEAQAIEAAPLTMKRPKSPGEMHAHMREHVEERTGRSLADWIKLLRAQKISDWREGEQWLKQQHGLSTMYAYMVAGAALGGPAGIDYGDEGKLLDALYSGERGKLRPIYEELRRRALKLGPEVQEVVCKTYTSLRCHSQFAVIAPTTRTLLDLALALPPDTPLAGRLEECRPMGGGERNRHRIRLGSVKDIDAEVLAWLKAAYAWDVSTERRRRK